MDDNNNFKRKKSTILIVDDAPQNIDILINFLETEGYNIAIAMSGEAAIEILSKVNPDLIFLDVVMPGIDGYTTCQKIKAEDKYKDLPIIFVTGKTDITDLKQAFDAGAVDYIRKPIQKEEVIARANTHLALRQLSKTLEFNNSRLTSILNNITEGTFCISDDGLIDCINSAASTLLGYKAEELINQPISVIAPDLLGFSKSWQDSIIYNTLQNNYPYYSENISLQMKSGSRFPAELTIAALNHENLVNTGSILAFRNITEQKRSEELMVSLMSIDQLTGLVNWSQFSEDLNHILNDAEKTEDIISLYLIDLDNFRDFNDAFGHDTGDLLLTKVANRLIKHFSDEELITRLGGDEFAILFKSISKVEEIIENAQKIINLFHKEFNINGSNTFLTVSIGVATNQDVNFTAGEMIKAADTALFRAKQHDKGTFQLFTKEMQLAVVNRIKVTNELRSAIPNNEFIAFYQPQISAETGAITGMEALVRWNHNGTIIYPNDFINIAEDSGLIVGIGDYMLKISSRQAKQWADDGRNIIVSVNISARQLKNPRFVENTLDIIKSQGADPHTIELELTESTLMEDPKKVIDMFNRLRSHGVRIAIDDFGTGFSSLSYIRRLNFDALKIDQSFVMEIGEKDGAETIVRTIIAMAHNLGHEVIAEGVETENHAAFLRKHGCETLQGYLYSKPLPIAEIKNLLEQWQPS